MVLIISVRCLHFTDLNSQSYILDAGFAPISESDHGAWNSVAYEKLENGERRLFCLLMVMSFLRGVVI